MNQRMSKSTYEKVIQLNSTYKPLLKRAAKCQVLLKSANKTTKFVWANNHYEKYNGKYVCEAYPIPVVEIEGIGDVGFDLNDCFYKGYFAKEKLLVMDLDLLKEIGYFALYGESDCLNDIYNSSKNWEKQLACCCNSQTLLTVKNNE